MTPSSERAAAWWKFVDFSREHEQTSTDTKLKKPPQGARVWKSIAQRITSEQKRSELFREWLRLHVLCVGLDLPDMTVAELTNKAAVILEDEIPF